MKPEVLRALLVDRELGELPPDVRELLEAYLEAVPSARAEMKATAGTISVARKAIRQFSELTPKPESAEEGQVVSILPWVAPWPVRVAALIAVAALAGWFGYRAGAPGNVANTQAVARATDHRFDGLWTRYQVAYDTHNGAVIVEKQQ